VALQYALTEPTASIADASHLSAYNPQDVRFELGRHLAYYRPEHYIWCLDPTSAGLRGFFLSAVRVVRPSAPIPGNVSGMLGETVEQLQEGLSPVAIGQLAKLVDALLKQEASLDISAWLRAIEVTACRAGLLLCGDISSAARMLNRRPPDVPGLKLDELLKHLLAFSVTEGYFRLRQAVGITIEG
jgi:hypothetical protein